MRNLVCPRGPASFSKVRKGLHGDCRKFNKNSTKIVWWTVQGEEEGGLMKIMNDWAKRKSDTIEDRKVLYVGWWVPWSLVWLYVEWTSLPHRSNIIRKENIYRSTSSSACHTHLQLIFSTDLPCDEVIIILHHEVTWWIGIWIAFIRRENGHDVCALANMLKEVCTAMTYAGKVEYAWHNRGFLNFSGVWSALEIQPGPLDARIRRACFLGPVRIKFIYTRIFI